MRDSLAKTLASLAIKPDWEKELEAASTGKSCGLLASLSPDKSFWKTCQQSLVTDSEPYSQTWPRWGMTAGGFAYAHPMSERRITGIGGGDYVPTPQARDWKGSSGRSLKGQECDLPTYVRQMFATPNTLDGMPPKSVEKILAMNRKHRPGRSYAATNLREQVVYGKIQMWPTPNASDNRDRGNMSDPSIQRRIAIGKQIGLSTAVKETQTGGTLNPLWVEWLVGVPIGWSVLKDSETYKSQCKPPSRIQSLIKEMIDEANK
jgi:DNA (cytosine-5)-methyltransferase 1